MLRRATFLVLLLWPTFTAAQDLPVCAIRTRSPPVLARYDELSAGARFRVTVRFDRSASAWLPAPPLGQPRHHASAIRYVGYTLPAPSDRTIELEITAVERVLVRYARSQNTWFFEYRVRVENACTLR